MSDTPPDPGSQAVNRALLDIIRAANAEGNSGPLDWDALMEAQGGEAAAQWRLARAIRQAWDTYSDAEQAYWDTVEIGQLKLQTAATLRMAETTLLRTSLTQYHRSHGWSENIVQVLAYSSAPRFLSFPLFFSVLLPRAFDRGRVPWEI